MRVFAPGWLSSRDEFISVSGHFLVALYTISSRNDFTPGRFHPCQQHQEEISSRDETYRQKCHLNGLPGIKVPCVKSVREGMDEMNSTPAGRLPG